MADAKENFCTMQMIEIGVTDGWICSACETEYPATRKFEKSTHCPGCEATISEWEAFDDD